MLELSNYYINYMQSSIIIVFVVELHNKYMLCHSTFCVVVSKRLYLFEILERNVSLI